MTYLRFKFRKVYETPQIKIPLDVGLNNTGTDQEARGFHIGHAGHNQRQFDKATMN